MDPVTAGHPASLEIHPPARIANWRPLVQWLLAIPHYIVLYGLGVVSGAVGLISWFAILFTGRLPEGLAGAQCMCLRYQHRLHPYVGFLHDEYPPFGFATTPADPGDGGRVRVSFAPELDGRNRLTAAFRVILVIPHLLALLGLTLAAGVCTLIALFAVLFTGRWPLGLRGFVIGVQRWTVRVNAYLWLLTDRYPPFSLD